MPLLQDRVRFVFFFYQKPFHTIQIITKMGKQSSKPQIFHQKEQKTTAKHLSFNLSFVRLRSLRRIQLVRSVTVVPPTSSKVKINVKLALIFKISYSIPCFSVCEGIRVISLRISSQIPCQGIC